MASQFRQAIFSFDIDMDADVHESPKKIKAGKESLHVIYAMHGTFYFWCIAWIERVHIYIYAIQYPQYMYIYILC